MGLFKRLRNRFYRFKDNLEFDKAVEKAEAAHELHGQRFYILPSTGGQLVIVDRKNYRMLRMKHYIPSQYKMQDAIDGCFYHTAHRDGSGVMPKQVGEIKKEAYYEFKEYSRRQKNK